MQLLDKVFFVALICFASKAEENISEKSLVEENVADSFETPATEEPIVFLPAPRIVGGSIATEGQFPHQVSIRRFGQHVCGGSIISKNYILTAAHCVVSSSGTPTPASQLSIRAGSLLLNSGGVTVQVSQVKAHPSFRNFYNDIAVLKLAKPLTPGLNIAPIVLSSAAVPSGSTVVTSGWGRVKTSANLSPRLLYINLRAISNQECRRVFGPIQDSILCLDKNRNAGVCFGDSGGPAVYKDRLVGVTNFIVGSCGTNAPDGYARVSSFIPWIRTNSENTAIIV